MAAIKDVVDELITKTSDGALGWTVGEGGWRTDHGDCSFKVMGGIHASLTMHFVGRVWLSRTIRDNAILPLVSLLEKKYRILVSNPTEFDTLQAAMECLNKPASTATRGDQA